MKSQNGVSGYRAYGISYQCPSLCSVFIPEKPDKVYGLESIVRFSVS